MNIIAPSTISIIICAIPIYWQVYKSNPWKKTLITLSVLWIYALTIEYFALVTGFPYGSFGYEKELGYKIGGILPWTVGLAWSPIALHAYAHSVRTSKLHQIISTVIIMIAYDLILDPAAVYLNFWQYNNPGWYYQVPWSNYTGWLLSSIPASIFLAKTIQIPTNQTTKISFLCILNIYTLVNIFAQQWIPTVLGILLSLCIISRPIIKNCKYTLSTPYKTTN